MKHRKLTPAEERVIVHKGTEPPFTGEYDDHFEPGVYTCGRCGAELYRSRDKFHSGCGWPSFDDEIEGAVKRTRDADGMRVEITCAACGGHLGHVFAGEELTPKNIRHCVNSISLGFKPEGEAGGTERIVLGGGCFWCVEAVFSGIEGILAVTPGYAGGITPDPDYHEVCTGTTGHAEVVMVEYDPGRISPERILEVFFASHDPTTPDRQGNDVGTQYRSIILCTSEGQKSAVERFIDGISGDYDRPVVTQVKPLERFHEAEEYHRRYFEKNPSQPYCRAVIAPKVDKVKKSV